MGKRKKSDPLISALECALDLGEFIPYNRSWDFVRGLEEVKHKIDTLVKDGQAERAVSLYEIFLSGCYEKADEIDDSGGNLGMFFESKDTHAYLALCERTGTTPKDCENIANIYKVKRKYQDALNWDEKGLKYGKNKQHNRNT
jgi:hypothetical protein